MTAGQARTTWIEESTRLSFTAADHLDKLRALAAGSPLNRARKGWAA